MGVQRGERGVVRGPADPDAALRATLREYARTHPLHGFRRAWAHLRHDQAAVVNKKKVHRLWKEEGLQVWIHHPRTRSGVSSCPQIETDAPHVVCAVDFQFDSTIDGKPIKIASRIDEHTRQSLLNIVERSITAQRLTDELDKAFAMWAERRWCFEWTTDRSSFPLCCSSSAVIG
ncbi:MULTISPECIES: transposase [Rhodococcus]|uniref:Transposase n=1 Tax=Rhodococcus oxybenzonivorans TaxID=1990687 RepID=A0AAE4UXA4_9NOCA|nr:MULTISPECIES: transposase [Rhodococcus]MDV7243636.1 transposase [Rhodococcus oxybenzonivorans]MDV7264301.1 transposase [Rhodococcus oxybenzonivorans]MDV7275122.1 transposase [Rhodococcus oxybenzonivorans]MDV7335360.1 transposase [Rhodococcus oxybenzonivorans]MDV7346071.1 transposase [Rhodococcus oxybenzonivorans]